MHAPGCMRQGATPGHACKAGPGAAPPAANAPGPAAGTPTPHAHTHHCAPNDMAPTGDLKPARGPPNTNSQFVHVPHIHHQYKGWVWRRGRSSRTSGTTKKQWQATSIQQGQRCKGVRQRRERVGRRYKRTPAPHPPCHSGRGAVQATPGRAPAASRSLTYSFPGEFYIASSSKRGACHALHAPRQQWIHITLRGLQGGPVQHPPNMTPRQRR